jgi:hypothetical protein
MKNYFFRLLSIIIFLYSTTVLAQTMTDKDSKDVEIGVGGKIKLENLSRATLKNKFDWHTHLLWESRYVTEGRDNLSGKDIVSISSEFDYQGVIIVPWFAKGIAADYSEYNVNIIYKLALLDNLEMFLGYNYIKAQDASIDSNDTEISVDLVYFYKNRVQFLSSIYYSFDVKGAFIDLTLKKNYPINDQLSFELMTTLGLNAGYVADGHNGVNYGQLRTNFTYQIMKAMEVYAYASYNLPVNANENRYAGDKLLRNLFWSGVGFSYLF